MRFAFRKKAGLTGKGKRSTRIARVQTLFLLLLGMSGGAGHGETLRMPGEETAESSGKFFQEKFACVRWVESRSPDSKCLECHASILREENLAQTSENGAASTVMLIHAQHMRSGKVNFTCVTCHQSVDPYQTSSTGVRTQVPANMCFKCHFPHGQE